MDGLPSDSQTHNLGQLVEHLGVGVAIVSTADWSVSYTNPKFLKWFPKADTGDALQMRIGEFDATRAISRINQGKVFPIQVESRTGGREIPIAVELKPIPESGGSVIFVECQDASKQKQTEYMLESYSKMAEKHARDLGREKDRVEKLLLNIMPRSVYEEMKHYGMVTPQRFDNASVLLLDFVGFTDMAISRSPGPVVAELNDIFTAFDRIVELFGCERIKTMGDAYMAVSGLPEPNVDHAQNLGRVALRMKRYIERRNQAHPEHWRCRIGISSGPVVGSILGVQKYVYDIFGPGVNLAARMETLSEPMQITISESTYNLIRDHLVCTERGEFDVKGFGMQKLYSLEREQQQNSAHR